MIPHQDQRIIHSIHDEGANFVLYLIPAPLRIPIVDDHALLVKGGTNFLEHRGLQVVGSTAHGRKGLEQALRLALDLMLMDIIKPIKNSLDTTRLIKENGRQVIAYAGKLGLYME